VTRNPRRAIDAPKAFGKITARFTAWLRRRQASLATIETHVRGLRHFCAWYKQSNGALPDMRAVTAADVTEYRQHLRTHPTKKTAAPAKPATIESRMSALRAYYSYLCEQDVRLSNPMARIKREPRAAKAAPKSLSTKQLGKLLRVSYERIAVADSKRRPCDITASSCEARRDFAILTTLAYCGLRASELCALRLGDVKLGKRSGDVTVRRGKGEKYREVELSREGRKALAEWLAWRKHYMSDRACKAVFVGRRGPLTVRAVEFVVTKLARQAQAVGLEAEVTPHVLRHSFARRLVDTGAVLRDVQELMGHESIVTTSRYTRPSKQQRQQLVDKLDIEI
jgi:integrase/recombinase XerC